MVSVEAEQPARCIDPAVSVNAGSVVERPAWFPSSRAFVEFIYTAFPSRFGSDIKRLESQNPSIVGDDKKNMEARFGNVLSKRRSFMVKKDTGL